MKFLAPTSEITGIEVRQRVRSGPYDISDWGDLLEPHRLTLVMPDGKSVSMDAANMTWGASHGIVTSVYVRRPLEPVAFGAAVADLRRIMAELGIEPSAEMKQDLANLPADVPGNEVKGGMPYKFRVGMRPENLVWNTVSLLVDITPDPERGWFYLMDFSVDGDVQEVMQADWILGNGSIERWQPVTLELGAPVSEMSFHDVPKPHPWPQHDGQPRPTTYLSRDLVVYKEGDAERLRILVANGHLYQTEGRLSEIRFIPLWKPAPMPDVLKQLQTSLDEWKVELPPEAKAELTRWAEQPAMPKDYTWTGRASAPLNEKATLYWSVHPIPGWGWFVRMRISSR